MATNNTESTTTATTTTTTENNNDKSLFSKAKDVLVNLKGQVEDLLNENEDNSEIKGMPREKFEETKTELESTLHFKEQENLANDVAVEQSQNQNWAESQNQNQNQNWESQNQNKSGAEFQNQSGANMNMNYQEVNAQEFVKAPAVLHQQTEVVDDKKDEIKYSKLDQNEVHVLPTLHVQERPTIVEKEIEFEKPVEIKQTFIHKEKPVIIEKPTIIEKNEHYREATQLERNNEKVVKESISEQHAGNQDQQALLNLRQERIDTCNDTTPIIKHEKQHVKLDTEVREQPTQINEKEVVYQQPVEIERTNIENIVPKVREEVTLKKEHVYEKTAPEVYQDNTQVLEGGHKYFSQDTTVAPANTATTTVNTSRDYDNGVSNFNEADIARGNSQKKEIM